MNCTKMERINMGQVFVYFNLHKKTWSIKCLKTGLVIGHSDTVSLRDVQLRVSKRGRERVIAERSKNVHAGVVGTLIEDVVSQNEPVEATYNPYRYETFVTKRDEKPVFQAETARMIVSQGKASVWLQIVSY